MKDCYNACDAYSKKSQLTKLMQSNSWNSLFLKFAETFQVRRRELEIALQYHLFGRVRSIMSRTHEYCHPLSRSYLVDTIRSVANTVALLQASFERENQLLRQLREQNGDTMSRDEADLEYISKSAEDTVEESLSVTT